MVCWSVIIDDDGREEWMLLFCLLDSLRTLLFYSAFWRKGGVRCLFWMEVLTEVLMRCLRVVRCTVASYVALMILTEYYLSDRLYM
jgi:hypothetical protein